jgi:HPr kinase/phosphorylase
MSEQQQITITVEELYKHGYKNWSLRLVAGREGLGNIVSSNRAQKAGLALANFLECSTKERVQILGNTEMQYLSHLKPKAGKEHIENLLQCGLAAFIVTHGNKIPAYLRELMNQYNTPLFSSKIASIKILDLITHYLDYMLAPRKSIHANLLDIFGLGVMIYGESGVGKSECALELVARGHRLVADDIVEVKVVENEVLLGSCPEHIRYLMEVRGIGLIDVKDMFGVGSVRESKKVELMVNLIPWEKGQNYQRLGAVDEFKEVLGINIPIISLPVAPGRNLGILVEVAARHQLLRIKGINVAQRIINRMDRALKKQNNKRKLQKKTIEGAGLFE